MIESLKKNLIFVIALVVIVGGGIVWFVWQGGGDEVLEAGGGIEHQSQYALVRAEILSAIATLQAVRLDVSVLDDQAFRSLSEVPRPVTKEPAVRRRNPFVP